MVATSQSGLVSHVKSQAFTLLELLVVITVIGMLAALLLPALTRAKSHAHSATCKNHLRQMGMALQMYVQEQENKYPYYVNPYAPQFNDAVGPANTRYWWAKLLPYYPVKWLDKAYHCPGYKGAIAGEIHPKPPFGSYAYNRRGATIPGGGYINEKRGIRIRFTNWFGLGPAYHRNSPIGAVSETQIKMPSEMIAISESRFLMTKVNHNPGGYDDAACGWLNWSKGRGDPAFAFDPARHGRNYNLVFCDGHVGTMNPWVLFNPTNSAPLWNSDHQPHPELWVPE